jgi:hypothetical protein
MNELRLTYLRSCEHLGERRYENGKVDHYNEINNANLTVIMIPSLIIIGLFRITTLLIGSLNNEGTSEYENHYITRHTSNKGLEQGRR